MPRSWIFAQMGCCAVEKLRKWDVAQMRYRAIESRATGMSRSCNFAQMDVAEMGDVAQEESRASGISPK